MKEKFNELKQLKIKNFIFLLIAGFVNAIGVIIFLYPVKIYDSGISGLSMLLDQVTPAYLTISLFLIVLNVPIFLYGLKKQGLVFTVYSIYTVLIYSLFSYLLKFVFDIDKINMSPLAGNELLLCSIFGGAISGVGSGLTIRFGGAIDGIEVLSVIFSKKLNISVGTFVFIFSFLLYIVCGFVNINKENGWILPLYSIITYFIGSKIVDFVVDGIDRNKCAMIITSKAKEVSKALSLNFESSGTIVNARGGYSNQEKNIIYFVVNHFQINRLKTIVLEIDESAFISISDVTDVIKNEDKI